MVHTPVCDVKSALGFTVILGNCKFTARKPTRLCKLHSPFPTKFPLFLSFSWHPVSSKEVGFCYFVVVRGFFLCFIFFYTLRLWSSTWQLYSKKNAEMIDVKVNLPAKVTTGLDGLLVFLLGSGSCLLSSGNYTEKPPGYLSPTIQVMLLYMLSRRTPKEAGLPTAAQRGSPSLTVPPPPVTNTLRSLQFLAASPLRN